MTRDIRTAGLIAAIVIAVIFGAVSRTSGMRVAFCATPDELAEVMPGLRLHALEMSNIGRDVRSNFLASALYSQHGLGDTGFYYVAAAILAGLQAAISERNLWLFTGVVNGVLIGLGAWLLWIFTRNRASVAAGVIIMAVSPFYVFTSQSGWGGRLTLVPLVQIAVLLLAWAALRRDHSWTLRIALAAAAFVLMLTDGFFFIAVAAVFLLLLQTGSLWDRARALMRHRVFWALTVGAVAGFALGAVLAVVAAQRGTRLTLYRHAFLHAGSGTLVPSLDVVRAWIRTFQWYFPDAAYFWLVLAAWLLAVSRALRSPIAGTLAIWWLLVGVTLMSYAASLSELGPGLVLGWANGPYHLALPSYLLLAWAAGELMGKSAWVLRAAGALAIAAVAVPLAAMTVSGEAAPVQSLRGGDYANRRAQCETVKAASYFVRATGTPASTVFHLSNDEFLGYFGEFYYGLSYSRNLRTGERNRLLDFGQHVAGRKTAPEDFARAYGVDHFDYYVEFRPAIDPFATQAIERLESAGAQPVFEVHNGGRTIGRVWSFERRTPVRMEFSEAARRWDEFATLDGLIQQPLAGTTYHFGYSWLLPDQVVTK